MKKIISKVQRMNWEHKFGWKFKIDLYKKQQGICNACKRFYPIKYIDLLDLDHIHSLKNGGGHEKENMQLLCQSCNILKGGKGNKTRKLNKKMKGAYKGRIKILKNLVKKYHFLKDSDHEVVAKYEMFNIRKTHIKYKQYLMGHRKGIAFIKKQKKKRKPIGNRLFSWRYKFSMFYNINGICPLCKRQFPPLYIDSFEIDHIIPKSRGGAYISNNIQLLCRSCNIIKGTKDNEISKLKVNYRMKIIKENISKYACDLIDSEYYQKQIEKFETLFYNVDSFNDIMTTRVIDISTSIRFNIQNNKQYVKHIQRSDLQNL